MGLFPHHQDKGSDHSEQQAETTRELAEEIEEQAPPAPESLIWEPPNRGEMEEGI